MDASTTGAKGSTSKRERGVPDKHAGVRRARVAQAMVMQAGLGVIILIMTWLSRGDTRTVALYLSALVVPAAWAYAFWTGHRREEAAREERRWTPELAKKERTRAIGILAGAVALWLAIAVSIVTML